MALFESYDRRIDHINAVLNEYGINGIEDAKAICDAKGIDPYTMCKETQPICFENACWAYVVGAAIAIKKGCTNAAEAAEAIGIGLQAFCIAGSVHFRYLYILTLSLYDLQHFFIKNIIFLFATSFATNSSLKAK